MSIGILTTILFSTLIISLLTGCPVGFALGGVGLGLGLIFIGPSNLASAYYSTWSVMSSFIFIAVPLFIFMGALLQRSGMADALYRSLHQWMGRLNGGLAIGTIIICTFMAAMMGIIGAGIVTMGILALPEMLKRGYDKKTAMGAVMAGGGLGSLIPPSIAMLVYAGVVKISVGKLFAAGIIPGLILSGLYISYIGIRCYLNPAMGPALLPEERGTLRQKIVSLKDSVLAIALIVLVLGSIFAGIATPSEASAIGAFGAIVVCAIYHKLNWGLLKESMWLTTKIWGMLLWLLAGAFVFARFYTTMGARTAMETAIMGLQMSPLVIIIVMMLIVMIMGMFVQESAIILIVGPIFNSIIVALGYDAVWFGLLFILNIQMAQISPPFGSGLFYMKGVLPEENMQTIFRSAIPFLALQVIGLVICIAFPGMVLWLPNLLIK